MKQLVLFEKIFTIITLTLFTGAPLVVILSGGASQGEGGGDTDFVVINIIFIFIYLIALCLLALRWKKAIETFSQGWLLWLLMGLIILSISWSSLPNITFSRIIAMLGTMIFSLYFASRYTIKEQIELVGWTLGIEVVTSILFALLLPQYGQMTGVHNTLWRGVFSHKNVLGKTMAISAFSFLILALREQKQRWIFWGLFTLSVLLLFKSKASSPSLNLMIVIMAFFSLQILRWRYSLLIPVLAGISLISVILYSFITSNADTIAGIFDKDLTFTGRTDLWPLVIDKIEQQPWLGHGFGAFWNGLDGPSRYIWSAIRFDAPNSHNGYLDLLLELGIIGFLIYVTQFLICCFRAITYIRFNRTADGLWPSLLLLYIVLSNLTESGLLLQNNFFLTLQLSVFLSLGLVENKYQPELMAEQFD
jgi:exopolysaccharide production protein ExoQ